MLNNAGEVAFSTAGATGLAAGTYYGLPQSLQVLPGSVTALSVTGVNECGTLAGISSASATERVFTFSAHSGALYSFHLKTVVTVTSVAINRFGVVSGSCLDKHGVSHAFVRKDDRTTVFDMPVGSSDIIVNAINASGRVVGTFVAPGMGSLGFLYNGVTVSVIEPPQIVASPVMDINDRGTMILNSFGNLQLLKSYRITCHGVGC